MLIKGGFVAVPMGLAASRQGVAFVTHDSDSTPGMANRIISKWAVKHATGMPAELYSYPENKTIYTGIPVSDDFSSVSSQQVEQLRDSHGLGNCKKVITVIGGSQGGLRLNQDFIAISKELMKDDSLGIIHIAGQAHETATKESYESFLEEAQLKRVVVRGFVKDLARYTGAADVVVSRAGANAIAELSLQKKAVILVPGKLADGHQNKNADYLEQKQAVRQVASDDPQALLQTIRELLDDPEARNQLASKLHELSKPTAAQELANLTLEQAK